MNWLSANWAWIAVGVGALFLITRTGGCGMGHSGGHGHGGGGKSVPPASDNAGPVASGQDGQQPRTHRHGCC
jgi:hypothetical protein